MDLSPLPARGLFFRPQSEQEKTRNLSMRVPLSPASSIGYGFLCSDHARKNQKCLCAMQHLWAKNNPPGMEAERV
jgi:hypothetical protein